MVLAREEIKEEYAKPCTNYKGRGVSYEKFGLTIVAVTPLRDAVGSSEQELIRLWNKQYITRTRTTPFPTVQTHTPHCMQEDEAYSRPVV